MNLSWDVVNKDDNTDKIHEIIIDHVRKNHCCRVGWACKKVMGQEVQENVLDKMAARVVVTGEFIKETSNINFKYDWNITKNPSYRFRDRHPYLFEAIIVLISVIISTIVGFGVKVWDTPKEPTLNTSVEESTPSLQGDTIKSSKPLLVFFTNRLSAK